MNSAVCITLIIALTFLAVALPLVTAWVYYRGTVRGSPIPKFSSPFAKPDTAPSAAEPSPPVFGCPKCATVRAWKPKAAGWECGKCNFYLRHSAGVLASGALQGVL